MISRRDFLKMLGVAATTATVGLPAVAPSATEAAPLWLGEPETALIDELVTPVNPLCWIGLDKYWYPAGRIDMQMETLDITTSTDAYRHAITRLTGLTATVFGAVDARLAFEMQEHSIVFRWYGHAYKCRGYVGNLSAEPYQRGIVTDLEIALSSPLVRL